MTSRHNYQTIAFGIALISPLLIASCAAIAAAEAPAVYSQSGDIGANEAVVWARCNNQIDSRLIIDLSTSRDFGDAHAGQSTAKEVQHKVERKVSADTDYSGTWINKPAKDFVAITLDEYRANWRYNLGDEKLQHFLLNTSLYIQWDDHEVTNNWYPGEILTDAPYNGIAANILAERSRQALFEYNPIAGDTIHRKFRHGKHLELFLLDERSFRGPKLSK